MIPFLKFYIRKNPDFGKPKKPFKPPTKEQFERYKDIVGDKAIQEYDRYVERMREEHNRDILEHTVDKAAIESEKDVTVVERREDFIQWIT